MRRHAYVDQSRRGRRREPEAVGQYGLEAGAHDLTDQGGRGVVAAAGPPFVRVHHSLEHATEHVGSNELAGVMLPYREVESLKQVVERAAPVTIAPDRRAVSPLQG